MKLTLFEIFWKLTEVLLHFSHFLLSLHKVLLRCFLIGSISRDICWDICVHRKFVFPFTIQAEIDWFKLNVDVLISLLPSKSKLLRLSRTYCLVSCWFFFWLIWGSVCWNIFSLLVLFFIKHFLARILLFGHITYWLFCSFLNKCIQDSELISWLWRKPLIHRPLSLSYINFLQILLLQLICIVWL